MALDVPFILSNDEGVQTTNLLNLSPARAKRSQASSYLTRKDLDQARKDMATMNVQLKVGGKAETW